jgi:hypothetical protein
VAAERDGGAGGGTWRRGRRRRARWRISISGAAQSRLGFRVWVGFHRWQCRGGQGAAVRPTVGGDGTSLTAGGARAVGRGRRGGGG